MNASKHLGTIPPFRQNAPLQKSPKMITTAYKEKSPVGNIEGANAPFKFLLSYQHTLGTQETFRELGNIQTRRAVLRGGMIVASAEQPVARARTSQPGSILNDASADIGKAGKPLLWRDSRQHIRLSRRHLSIEFHVLADLLDTVFPYFVPTRPEFAPRRL